MTRLTANRPSAAASRLTLALALAGLVSGCGQSTTLSANLDMTVKPARIDNVTGKAVITVTATDAQGKIGTGTVRLVPTQGVLDETDLTLDSTGSATATFTCPVATDMACKSGTARIDGQWVSAGKLATNSVSVSVFSPVVDAGAPDAGPVDAGPVDAGPPDAGSADAGAQYLTLTADKSRIFTQVGDSTTLTATLRSTATDAGVAGELVTFATTLGAIQQDDGGTGGVFTNNAGVATAKLTETGVNGTATVTATSGGLTASTMVDILSVTSVMYTSTSCSSGSACTVMGVKGSGFNESVTVKFKLIDAQSRPVVGVRANFTIDNPPSGVQSSMTDVSDMNGEVKANVTSGTTIGSFTVNAIVVSGSVQTQSTTISIRGAKAANKGLSLQCAFVNMAAYIAPAPPKVITDSCTVTLVDRYNNPVGVPTTIKLLTEAGTVPASVTSTAFMPGSANPNEGQAQFTFSTTGSFPALDVAPLTVNAQQYPQALDPEPSRQVGGIIRNPRDGMVSLIASVPGEEYFDDTNSNGTRDVGERFYDQGEPLVDANDNDKWDPGETYIDVNGNNQWDGPNGQWDSNTNIWTSIRLLYTSTGDLAYFTPVGWSLPKGPMGSSSTQQISVQVFAPDLNINRVEGGSALAVTLTGGKGSLMISSNTSGLDGYGFSLDQNSLLNDTGTGPCLPATPVCRFFTRFSTWEAGKIGDVLVQGAPGTDTTNPVTATMQGGITTRGVTVSFTGTGTIQ